MKVLKFLAWVIGLIVLAAVILLFVAPTKTHIERSIVINAPATTVWEHIVKFEEFNKWNAWRKTDSQAQYTTTGQDGTVGAVNSWKGSTVGEGRLEHIALEPYKSIRQKLTFIKPFEAASDVYFHLDEQNGKTAVTWGFDTDCPRPQNVMYLFMGRAMKRDFDSGLQGLKQIAEADTVSYTGSLRVQEMDFPATTFATIRKQVKWPDIPQFYQQHLPLIYKAVVAAKLKPGVATGLFYTWDEQNHLTDMAAAVPVPAGASPGNDFAIVNIPATRVAYVDHYGPYEKTLEAHIALEKYLTSRGRKADTPVMEMYITDPSQEKDTSKWLTKVVYPIKSEK